jgi:hypothetical protein
MYFGNVSVALSATRFTEKSVGRIAHQSKRIDVIIRYINNNANPTIAA